MNILPCALTYVSGRLVGDIWQKSITLPVYGYVTHCLKLLVIPAPKLERLQLLNDVSSAETQCTATPTLNKYFLS